MFRRYPTRYGNTRQKCPAGHSHASKLEAAICTELHRQQFAGDIRILKSQDYVRLTASEIVYIADFKVQDTRTQEIYWVEAKGFENDRWPIIKKLWAHYGPGRLVIYKGTYTRYRVHEVIQSKL